MENLRKNEENKNYPSPMAQLSGIYPFSLFSICTDSYIFCIFCTYKFSTPFPFYFSSLEFSLLIKNLGNQNHSLQWLQNISSCGCAVISVVRPSGYF